MKIWMTSRDLLIKKTIILTRPAQYEDSHQTATRPDLSWELNQLYQILLLIQWRRNDHLAKSLKHHILWLTSHKLNSEDGILKMKIFSNWEKASARKILMHVQSVPGLSLVSQVTAKTPPWTVKCHRTKSRPPGRSS